MPLLRPPSRPELVARTGLALAIGLFLLSGCGDPQSSDVGDSATEAVGDTAESAPANTADSDPGTQGDAAASLEATAAPTRAPEPTDTADAADTGDTAATSESEGADPAELPDTTDAAEPPQPDDDALPASAGRPAAPNGRIAPDVARTAEELAAQLAAAEAGLVDPASTPAERADWGHLHQVAIRRLGYAPEWDVAVFGALPNDELVRRTVLHVTARRSLIDLASGYDAADFIPAWEIIEPEPAAALLEHYRSAEAATGIEWEYLAAINLVETGMGRIRGLSSAGAQGPMQFLPTTWAESGIGEGDINDPADAIAGAARYLVRRGGPADMPGAIWGYNNSDDYVTAVRNYAELLRDDPTAYEAIYNWEIYFFTEAGDVWLPTGFITAESVDLDDFLATNPWSVPDPGLR